MGGKSHPEDPFPRRNSLAFSRERCHPPLRMKGLKRVWQRVASDRVFGISVGVVAAVVFGWSTTAFVRNKLRYAQVTSWPSVPVTIRSLANHSVSLPRHFSRSGQLTGGSVGYNAVRFEYTVDGKAYQGTRPSPDDEIRPNPFSAGVAGAPPEPPAFRAYYLPEDPAVAVLFPLPYQGTGLLATAIVSGGLLGLYAFFSLKRFE